MSGTEIPENVFSNVCKIVLKCFLSNFTIPSISKQYIQELKIIAKNCTQ